MHTYWYILYGFTCVRYQPYNPFRREWGRSKVGIKTRLCRTTTTCLTNCMVEKKLSKLRGLLFDIENCVFLALLPNQKKIFKKPKTLNVVARFLSIFKSNRHPQQKDPFPWSAIFNKRPNRQSLARKTHMNTTSLNRRPLPTSRCILRATLSYV